MSRVNVQADICFRDDYNAIFLPLLHRVGAVLRGQLEMAMSKKKVVKVKSQRLSQSLSMLKLIQKDFLICGLRAAPSLRSFLSSFLKYLTRELKVPQEIRLITTNDQDRWIF